ncbi:hypothetical protein BIW11_03069 [Tropilaelaps mercedesae]|uniref:Uncharacterized protein n=1 Tax=Tropilaelaps mercedesae TaxID=418985 RepID=A0A1V9XSI9_9ACAR|nr:hypothetical protein BIW11_03069 [Tropilaelaps mercedesae]
MEYHSYLQQEKLRIFGAEKRVKSVLLRDTQPNWKCPTGAFLEPYV